MRLTIEIDDLAFINRWKDNPGKDFRFEARFSLPQAGECPDAGYLHPAAKRHEELARLEELVPRIMKTVEDYYSVMRPNFSKVSR